MFNLKISVLDKQVPVLGNTALVSDHNAIALHGLIPSVQLPLITSVLNERGVYVSDTNSVSISRTQKHDSTEARTAELQRTLDILIHENGMKQVFRVEAGSREVIDQPLNYIVMRKPNGPKVKAFLLEGQKSLKVRDYSLVQ